MYSNPTITYDDGNKFRYEPARVRCAYSKTGIKAVDYPLSQILGTYTITSDSNATGSQNAATFYVTISESDNSALGNVKLSSYLHHSYHSDSYPQYAQYDVNTGKLSIPMNQVVGRNNNQDVKSTLNNGSDQPLVLQYSEENSQFTVEGDNYLNAYRGTNTNRNRLGASYIQSFN